MASGPDGVAGLDSAGPSVSSAATPAESQTEPGDEAPVNISADRRSYY